MMQPAVVRVGQRPGHEDETERRQELHHADQPEMEGGAGEREDVPGHAGAHHRHGGGRAEAAGEVCHDGAGSEDGRHARAVVLAYRCSSRKGLTARVGCPL